MSNNFLLDTDVVVSYLRGHVQTVDMIKALARTGATFFISVVTVVEIEAGIRARERLTTRAFLEAMEILILDTPTATLAGSLLREYRLKGTTLSLADVMIAATAITEGLVLLTYNQRLYPMPEIRLHKT